jgi:hypothetical protein
LKKFFIIVLVIFAGCSTKPVAEKISGNVLSSLRLLNEKPQFVMYLNFQNMRQTNFWKNNISDSILNSERTFGSILNDFKNVTGVSISEGLDEFYLSNSWDGENAMVLKGAFDRNRTDDYISKDSNYTKQEKPGNIKVYYNKRNNLSFFFKDNFTICASNFSAQIDDMINSTDTSNSGVLKNDEVMQAIKKIVYKNNLWMVSTEKMFIRGIFLNYIQSKNNATPDTTPLYRKDSTDIPDTIVTKPGKTDDYLKNKIHESINSIGFSAKMKDDLELLIQCDCTDNNSAGYIYKLFSGLITIAKFNSTLNKSKEPSETEKILESLKINRYESSVQLVFNITRENISAFRKTQLLTKPE